MFDSSGSADDVHMCTCGWQDSLKRQEKSSVGVSEVEVSCISMA